MDVQDCRVLLAVGRSAISKELRQDLRAIGFGRIEHVEDGLQALMAVKKQQLDLMLIEDDLKGLDGFEVVRLMHNIPRFVGPRVIVVAQHVDRALVEKAAQLQIRECLVRPFSRATLKERIEAALDATLL